MIRYFCSVAPGAAGDIAHGYLQALSSLGRPFRAQSIGMAAFDCERRWWRVSALFQTPVRTPYVNIVCARLGLKLGHAMPLGRLGPSEHLPDGSEAAGSDALDALERQIGGKLKPAELVYQPESALVGLYTVGCVNIAITFDVGHASPRELEALSKYDAIITPFVLDRADLESVMTLLTGRRHSRVLHIQPRSDLLGPLLDDLCGSSTSVTTAPSPATAAQLATTSPASTGPATRSRSSTGARSRALPLRAEPSHQNLAIVTSTRWSRIGRRLMASFTGMWRSIMRSLGFWRR